MLPLLLVSATAEKALVVLLLLLWVTAFFGVVSWMVLGQRAYLRHYRAVHRLTPAELPLSDEFNSEQLRQFPVGTRHILEDRLEAMLTAQADAYLERLRQRMLWRFGLAVACGVSGIVLFAIIST